MERRLSVRRAIDHDATIRIGQGKEHPCVISDFCEMGILLTFSDLVSQTLANERRAHPNQTCHISFLKHDGNLQRLLVRVVHHTANTSGIQFRSAESETFNALDEIHRIATAQIVSRSDQQKIVAECAALMLKDVSPLLENTLSALQEKVKGHALNAENDRLATAFLDFSKTLERLDHTILKTFQSALNKPIEFLREDFERHNRVSQELTVVEKEEFEDWLKARVIITRAESTYYSQLLPLKMRLDAIGLATEHRKLSPFGPELIVLAFRHAVSGLSNHAKVEKLLFEEFEHGVMEDLEELYEALNDILIQHKVLPDLDVAKTRRAREEKRRKAQATTQQKVQEAPAQPEPEAPQAPGPRPIDAAQEFEAVKREFTEFTPPPARAYGSGTTPSEQRPDGADHMVYDAANDQAVGAHFDSQADASYQRVHDLLASLRKSSLSLESELAKIANQPEKFSRSELDQGIAMMQKSISPDQLLDESTPNLLERILNNLGEEGQLPSKGIESEQQVTIDVVDRFFNSMKQNPNLTSKAKEHMVSLEGPVLHSMLNEENVFGEANHVIHQILNQIGLLGSLGVRLSTKNQSRVDDLIHELRHNYQDDQSIADTVVEELTALVSKHRQSYNKNIERVAAAAEGALKVSDAKAAVADALNERFAGEEIPKAVSTLIDNGWRDLLNLVYIKDGPESASWNEHLEVIDNLLHYSRNPSHPLDMKNLLAKIQAGLSSVSPSNVPPAPVREDLKKLITDAPNRDHELVQAKPEVGVEVDPEEQTLTKNEKIFNALKPWIIRARGCTVGTWMSFEKTDADLQYIRLVWVAKHFSKFVFVNHQGMKVIELGLFKFANYLKQGKIKPEPEYSVPIINQGLDSMIKDVYEDIAEEKRVDHDSRIPTASAFKDQIRSVMAAHDKDKACQIIYLRAQMSIDGRATSLTPASKKQMGELLMEVCSLETVAGHINERDFALFSVAEKPLGESTPDQLAMFIDVPKECQFSLHCAEVAGTYRSAHLDRMIAEAAGKLNAQTDPESTRVETEDEYITINEVKVLEENDAREAVREHIANDYSEDAILVEEPIDLDTVEASGLHQNEHDAGLFDLFGQLARGLKDEYQTLKQAELIPSKPGSGLAYEPKDQDDCLTLDQWWLSHLVTCFNTESDPWSTFDEIRIKLSAYSLNDDNMIKLLTECATQSLLPADKLWFDLYNSYAIEDVHAAADRIATLNEHGYRFCLDQFGSSNAPFSLLKGLPVDMIKVDEKYMSSLNKVEADEDEDQADSIIEVAQYLGKKVLSGSVNTAICLQRMKKLNVDFVQGTHIDRYRRLEDILNGTSSVDTTS